MTQFVMEGLISDVLSEHFGEGVELVGVALLRSGPLTVAEILRVANRSLLNFPRDSANPLNAFAASSVEAVGWKQVRDSLLVLLHFGLVVQTDSKYCLNAEAVLRRLAFPLYLETIDLLPGEKQVLQTLLRRGPTVIGEDEEESVKSLVARKLIVSVDACGTSKKKQKLIFCANTEKLHATLIASLAAQFAAQQLGPLAGQLVQLLAADAAAISELETRLKNVAVTAQIIANLMKLQQLGWVTKSSSSASVKRNSSRVMNNKQLLDDPSYWLDEESAVPSYTLHLGRIVHEMQLCVTRNLITARFGVEGARVYAASLDRKLEAHSIAEQCAISREDCLKHLHALALEGICQIQEVPKVTGSLSMAGGVAAMMRALSSSFWLYSVDSVRARETTVSWVATTVTNLRRRFRHEVFRQCRIEDRAGTISQTEEAYLFRVHEAQDRIEASSIGLMNALAVLMAG